MGLMNVGFQMAKNALAAQRLSLEITGNNIANANNDTYSRRRVNHVSGADIHAGQGLYFGTGVRIGSIERMTDEFLNGRIRTTSSESESLLAQRQVLTRLEDIYNELGDNDLSSMLNDFWNALSDLRNFPEKAAQRQLVVTQAENLAEQLRLLRTGFDEVRSGLNEQYMTAVDSINSLAEQIADKNFEIIRSEGGGLYPDLAASLRDQRDDLLRRLSELVQIKTIEQKSGAVDVYLGSHVLVSDVNYFELYCEDVQRDGQVVADAYFAIDDAAAPIVGGKLHGFTVARDELVPQQIEELDRLVSTLIFEFNKIHAEGVGLTNFTGIRSVENVDDADAVLNDAGLAFSPVNGTFSIRVHNVGSGLIETVTIEVDLDGIGADDTLNTVVAKINAAMSAAGLDVRATVNGDHSMSIASGDADTEFSFMDDTSFFLAAMGINTFFTGADSSDIGVNALVTADINRVCAALTPVPGDGDNAGRLSDLRTLSIPALSGATIEDHYQSMISRLGIEAAVTASRSDGVNTYLDSLFSEREAISGVNLDEEAVNLMRFQRAFQGAARVISTIDEMMQTLISLV